MKILFETVNGKEVLKEFENGTLAKNFIVKNKDKLYKAKILDEGFLQNVGKGAMALACIGAAMLGIVSKPAEAKGVVTPTEKIEMTTEINNANGKGYVYKSIDKNGTEEFSSLSDENCERFYDNSKYDKDGNYFNQEFYSLECQSPDGKYIMKVMISNNDSGFNKDNFSDNFTENSIIVSSDFGKKVINLNDPNKKKLKEIVINALKRDMQDGKVVVHNSKKVSAIDLVKGNTLGSTSVVNNMTHKTKDKN